MPCFCIAVVTGNRWHKLRFIELDARIAKHFIHRLDGFGGHHGRRADFVNLKDCRSVTGAESGDTRRQVLFVVTFINRDNFVIRMRFVEAACQGIHFLAKLPLH